MKSHYEQPLKYIVRLRRSTPTIELTRDRIEEDMDFKIPGLPHSFVKYAQSTSVRQLVQKIENYPDRHVFLTRSTTESII